MNNLCNIKISETERHDSFSVSKFWHYRHLCTSNTLPKLEWRLNFFYVSTGLDLATYCMRYPLAIHFLWNKMPYSLQKTPKNICCLGVCSVINIQNLKKMSDKNPQLYPFTRIFCSFRLYRIHAPIWHYVLKNRHFCLS